MNSHPNHFNRKRTDQSASSGKRGLQRDATLGIAASIALFVTPSASASMFEGKTLDTIADVLSWVVLIIAPAIAIIVFWLVHILPEKIAEKRHHPQAQAIQTLCLLSLAFGGILWPLAWLWAYSKPVLYKMAYGTDVVEHDRPVSEPTEIGVTETAETKQLRSRIAQLKSQLRSARKESTSGNGRHVSWN
jgi:CBS domain containing-hemolysin-like protein